MESLFGTGLADVRLHRAALPEGMAACANGNHVLLSDAVDDLDTLEARRSLAHEVTHVLQQRRAEVSGRGLVINTVMEAEAECVAACIEAEGPFRQQVIAKALPVIRRLAGPAASGSASNNVVQPRIIIRNGTGAGVYDTTRASALFDGVAVPINGRYKGRPVRVRDEPVTNYLRSADYYRFDSMDALAAYMVQGVVDLLGEVSFADIAAPAANSPEPRLIYGAEHGDLHFGGNPTKNKAKWALSKQAACDLMEREIMTHHARIWRQTPLAGVAGLWYVAGMHRNCGRYKDATREGALTDIFAIQAQVFILENEIHYHGYPDEQIRNIGCGMTRNGVNANDDADVQRRGPRQNTIDSALRELGS
jgi:hypothetical protein